MLHSGDKPNIFCYEDFEFFKLQCFSHLKYNKKLMLFHNVPFVFKYDIMSSF